MWLTNVVRYIPFLGKLGMGKIVAIAFVIGIAAGGWGGYKLSSSLWLGQEVKELRDANISLQEGVTTLSHEYEKALNINSTLAKNLRALRKRQKELDDELDLVKDNDESKAWLNNSIPLPISEWLLEHDRYKECREGEDQASNCAHTTL